MVQTSLPPIPPPEAPPAARPRAAFIATAAAAIVAAGMLSWDRPGLGWVLTALAVAAAVRVAVRGGPRDTDAAGRRPAVVMVRAGWVAAMGMLIAVGAVRAAGWLFILCMVSAAAVACVALTDRRSLDDMLLAPVQVAASTSAALRWLARGAAPTPGRGTFTRTLIAGLVAVAMLVAFGALLTGADAAFAHTLSALVPSLDAVTLLRWTGSAALAVTVTAVAAHVLLTGATASERPAAPQRLVRRIEWTLPVGALVMLFAGFVAVEATVLFGGREHVLATAGLTYAQYARSGFWQLLAVTGLTVIVVAVASQIAPRTTRTDRTLLRTLLGLLSTLTLVIVASALSRMAAYEQAYGFTRQRLLVTATELWLGALLLLILIAGVRLRGRWVPQAALAAAVATVLGLAILNPDAFIARKNIARLAETGRIDLSYLRTLSADAIPALRSLPEPYRSCALAFSQEMTDSRSDAWYEWNLGRAAARTDVLQVRTPAPGSCALLASPRVGSPHLGPPAVQENPRTVIPRGW